MEEDDGVKRGLTLHFGQGATEIQYGITPGSVRHRTIEKFANDNQLHIQVMHIVPANPGPKVLLITTNNLTGTDLLKDRQRAFAGIPNYFG
jgi:hypothetical protein